VVIRRGTGGSALLAAVPLAQPSRAGAVLSIDDSHLLGLPESAQDDDVVSDYLISVRTGEGRDQVRYTDQRSVGTYGRGSELELDLRGLQLGPGVEPTLRALLPVVARVSELLGSPRRLWRVTVPVDVALRLAPGVGVLVTSRDLYGVGSGPGVVGVPARVQGLTVSPLGTEARLELVYDGAEPTLIHAAAGGTAAKGADLTLSTGRYTGGRDTVAARTWLDYSDFAAGDQVWLHTLGDPDGGAVVTVLGVATGPLTWTLTLTAPHGLAVGTEVVVEHLPGAAGAPARVLDLAHLSPRVVGVDQSYS
jgi:hypothetical protein